MATFTVLPWWFGTAERLDHAGLKLGRALLSVERRHMPPERAIGTAASSVASGESARDREWRYVAARVVEQDAAAQCAGEGGTGVVDRLGRDPASVLLFGHVGHPGADVDDGDRAEREVGEEPSASVGPRAEAHALGEG
jgi:hypothetical protein